MSKISKKVAFNHTQVNKYATEFSVTESPELRELRLITTTMELGGMEITPLQGAFLAFLIKLTNSHKILELGTFTGYSTLWMAGALPENGKIITCDIRPQWMEIGKPYWEASNVIKKIDYRNGPAIGTLDSFIIEKSELFDFIFIDADKENYKAYYEKSLELLHPNGMICIDNVLWDGKIFNKEDIRPTTEAIRDLNEFIKNDSRIEKVMLPFADGMTLAKKR